MLRAAEKGMKALGTPFGFGNPSIFEWKIGLMKAVDAAARRARDIRVAIVPAVGGK